MKDSLIVALIITNIYLIVKISQLNGEIAPTIDRINLALNKLGVQ